MNIAKEIGDRRVEEGGTYGSLGVARNLLGDYRKAIEYHEKYLKIAIEIGDRWWRRKEPMEISVVPTTVTWVTMKRRLRIMKNV